MIEEAADPQEHPMWDYDKDGKTYKSCAVIASDGEGHDVVLFACGPAIDWHIEQFGWSCDELGLGHDESGIWVWTGSMGSVRHETLEGTDYDHEVNGEYRRPTPQEWRAIAANECPWTKETLPRWLLTEYVHDSITIEANVLEPFDDDDLIAELLSRPGWWMDDMGRLCHIPPEDDNDD